MILNRKPCFAGIARATYQFKLCRGGLPSLLFTLNSNGLTFTGCNQHNILLQTLPNNRIQFLGKTTLTNKVCNNDNDK